ncbi:MAG: hypothetical protein ACR2MT_09495 [Aurantibacter sp.]
MMISCEKAAIICNKTQYNDATFAERIKLKFHLLVCKVCSKFSKKNAQLTHLCERSKLYSLTEEEKIRMKRELQNNS